MAKLACVFLALAAQTSMTVARWQEDLRALARDLPAKHEDAFHTVSREAFDAAVFALSLRIPSLASHDVAVELARIVAMIEDGHTELQLLQPASGFRLLPVVFYQYEEGLYVIAGEAPFKDIIGAKVLRIGDKPTEEASALVHPLLSGDTDVEHLHSGPTYLACPEILNALGIAPSPDSISLDVLTRGGERKTLTLPAKPARGALVTMRAAAGVSDPLSTSRPGEYYWFAPVPSTGAMYFQLNASMNQDRRPALANVTREFFKRVDAEQVKHLIIDVRSNNGGNIERNRDLLQGIADRPAFREKGRLFIITGRRTFSAGLDFVLEAQKIAAPMLVGESPRGLPARPGNRETFVLPNSRLVIDYSERIDSLAFRTSRRRTLPVDIAAPPRFDAAIAGRDPALDAIVGSIVTKH